MNSFAMTAIGNLGRNPELITKGDAVYARFCLVGDDDVGPDEEGTHRVIVTSIWFIAPGAVGEAIALNARKGDQLIVQASVHARTWTDKQGQKQHDLSFVVHGFKFGARHGSPGAPVAQACSRPPSSPTSGVAQAVARSA